MLCRTALDTDLSVTFFPDFSVAFNRKITMGHLRSHELHFVCKQFLSMCNLLFCKGFQWLDFQSGAGCGDDRLSCVFGFLVREVFDLLSCRVIDDVASYHGHHFTLDELFCLKNNSNCSACNLIKCRGNRSSRPKVISPEFCRPKQE